MSHRADNGLIDLNARRRGHNTTNGQLYLGTAFGLTNEMTRDGVPLVVQRMELKSTEVVDFLV